MAREITGAHRVGTAVVVSSDPGAASLAHEEFSALGYEVVEVQRGEEVIDALRLEAPDLVFFDGDLPAMSAIDFLGLARPLLGARKVPVVLARDGAAALKRGEGGDLVEVIINRPFGAEDLREAITIARWASDRSNDPRVSGGARPSQLLTSEPVGPTADDDAAADPKSIQAAAEAETKARTIAPNSTLSAKVPAARQRPKKQDFATTRKDGEPRPEQQQPSRQGLHATQSLKRPVNTQGKRHRPPMPTPQRTRPVAAIAHGQSRPPSQPAPNPNVQAPSAKKRFKRTLSFSPALQPTMATVTGSTAQPQRDSSANLSTTRPSRPSSPSPSPAPEPTATSVDLDAHKATRRPSRPTRHDGQPTAPRRRGTPLPPGTLIADRYVVRGILGTGGMAEVYRVHDRELEEEVALKLLKEDRDDPEIQARFRQEMRICRRMTHPAVVRTYEFGVWHSRRFITMEVLAGEDMACVLLRNKGPMAEDTVRRLFIQVCEGLHAAHAVGVIHRDVKPHNIFVLEGGEQARLMDFGIAKSQDHTTTAEAGMSIIGTPAYLPPERLKDDVAPTAKTDLYSVGASMYHAVTGHLPFGGADISSLLTAIVLSPLKPPKDYNPGLSDGMQRLIMTAMARDPADRPESCADMADQLRALGTTPTATG